MLLSPNVRREERVQRLQRRRDVRHGRGEAAGGLESFSIWNSMILRLLGRLAPLLCYIQEYISNWKTLEAAWLISTNKLSSDPALYMQTPPLQGCRNREGQGGQSRLPPRFWQINKHYVNQGGRFCPPHYYSSLRIFRLTPPILHERFRLCVLTTSIALLKLRQTEILGFNLSKTM